MRNCYNNKNSLLISFWSFREMDKKDEMDLTPTTNVETHVETHVETGDAPTKPKDPLHKIILNMVAGLAQQVCDA